MPWNTPWHLFMYLHGKSEYLCVFSDLLSSPKLPPQVPQGPLSCSQSADSI